MSPGRIGRRGGWGLLGVGALGVSTLCAIVLVAARAGLLQGYAATEAVFRHALVMHVNFAVIVWFLACAACIWTLRSGGGPLRWLALVTATAGATAMAIAPLVQRQTAVLANYVPVLDGSLFLSGLCLFIAGIALAGWSGLSSLRYAPRDAWHAGILLSILAAASAGIAFLCALAVLGLPASPQQFESIAWAPGHLLQFVHVLLMMSAWSVLAERPLGTFVSDRWLKRLLLATALPLLLVPLILVQHPPASVEYRHAFTLLMSWGVWPAAAMLALALLAGLAGGGREVWRAPESLPLALSLLLFLLGCGLGAAIRGESTMVPAHYHGTVGAVTLTYMTLGYHLLQKFGLEPVRDRLVQLQPLVYATGLMLLAGGLAWSGLLDMPRKSLPVAAGQSAAHDMATGISSLGGLLAILGAAFFVGNILRAVKGSGRKTNSAGDSRQAGLHLMAGSGRNDR